MRFVVLMIGFIGCLATAVLGMIFLFHHATRDILKEILGDNVRHLEIIFASLDKDSVRVGLFLLIGAAYGFLGSLLAFFRCGWQGALMLFVPVIGPAVLNPITLVGTSLQGFSGLLSILVRPVPINAVADEEDED